MQVDKLSPGWLGESSAHSWSLRPAAVSYSFSKTGEIAAGSGASIKAMHYLWHRKAISSWQFLQEGELPDRAVPLFSHLHSTEQWQLWQKGGWAGRRVGGHREIGVPHGNPEQSAHSSSHRNNWILCGCGKVYSGMTDCLVIARKTDSTDTTRKIISCPACHGRKS